MPGGGKHWRLAYRFAGKQKLLSGGPYPIVKLTDARKWRDEAKAQLLAGRDPSAVRKAEKRAIAAASESAFEKVAREWLSSRKAAWSPRYARIITTRLEQDIFPHLGTVPIAEIDPPMILAALRKIEARGSIEMAHRIRNHVGEVFRFGIATERCRSDPSRDIAPAMMRPPPVKHRAKVEARDLPAFFAKLARDEGEPMSHLALRWTILDDGAQPRDAFSPNGASSKGLRASRRCGVSFVFCQASRSRSISRHCAWVSSACCDKRPTIFAASGRTLGAWPSTIVRAISNAR